MPKKNGVNLREKKEKQRLAESSRHDSRGPVNAQTSSIFIKADTRLFQLAEALLWTRYLFNLLVDSFPFLRESAK